MTVNLLMQMQVNDPHVLNDHLKLLYQNAIPGIAITIAASAGLAFGFEEHSTVHYKFIWWLCLSAVVCFRIIDTALWFRRANKGLFSCQNDLYRFGAGVLLTAFLWAFYCVYFYNTSSIDELFSSLVIVSAMAGGAATVLSGNKLLSQIYTLMLLAPFSLQMILGDNPAHLLLGCLGLAYAAVMLSVANAAANFTKNSILLRNEHNQLLKTMEHKIQQRTQKIIELSQHDSLTQLLNRRSFLAAAKLQLSQIETDNQYAIFFLDLDGFKQVNDNFGHRVGDEVLTEVVKRIKQACQHDEIICRWGGDEFIIMAHQTPLYRFEELAIMLKKHINQPILTTQHVINMDCSIGIAMYPEHGQSISDLISLADLSMYSRKSGGTDDYVMFSGELEQKIKHEMHLSKGIAQAIAEQQLRLVFQPIIDSTTGDIASVEALLRWEFEGNNIQPDVFIPLAEKNGAIKQIGYWVLEESVRQLAVLHLLKPQLAICINVSVIQFEDIDFVNKVHQIINQYHVNPSKVHLEITESVFSQDKLKLINMVKALQLLGFMISIDDFGTGYSSLSVIQDLHVNTVKIDRSFINNLHLNGIDIVKAVMMMSHGLGYRIVAEGVENQQQANTLTALGIHYLQGYLFDKPLEFEALKQKLLHHPDEQRSPFLLRSANS
ncbi:EAL domain-containing protein [Shewanella sp. AC91-MNA-CIBAN-0169]|uniref:putative bifunctional diguanylate cyclase/phosphodiesterase n=1 Tax=Shewanella sp. AC91-MNA-CIBAN-0169 TaxID=3140466 RepID=UPI0033233843